MINRLRISIVFYVLAMVLLYVSKPPLMFMPDGSIKPFGTQGSVHGETTLFSFGMMSIAMSIITFFAFSVIDMTYSTGMSSINVPLRPQAWNNGLPAWNNY